MPITGLSERTRLLRLGKIHLGYKAKNARGVEYPVATDYFVIPEDLIPYLGEKPQELLVMLPVEDPDIWASQFYRCYSRTRGLVCKGDGITSQRKIDTETGAMADRNTKGKVAWEEQSCAGRECEEYQKKQCRDTMNLQFFLPEAPGIGVWQIDTSSLNSIMNINSCAKVIRAVCGRVSMLPLTLTLEPQEVTNPDDGKRKTVRVLFLRHKARLQELLLTAAKPVSEVLQLVGPALDKEAPGDMFLNGIELPSGDDEPPASAIEPQERGEIEDPADKPKPTISTSLKRRLGETAKKKGYSVEQVEAVLLEKFGVREGVYLTQEKGAKMLRLLEAGYGLTAVEPEPEPEPKQEKRNRINREWLREAMQQGEYEEVAAVSRLIAVNADVQTSDTLEDALEKLTLKQQKEFCSYVHERAEKSLKNATPEEDWDKLVKGE